MNKKFDVSEISDLLKLVPDSELTTLRKLMQEYQTNPLECDWVKARFEIDRYISDIRDVYGDKLADFFKASMLRVAYSTNRFLGGDKCLKHCKNCSGLEIYCDKYEI